MPKLHRSGKNSLKMEAILFSPSDMSLSFIYNCKYISNTFNTKSDLIKELKNTEFLNLIKYTNNIICKNRGINYLITLKYLPPTLKNRLKQLLLLKI